MARTDFASQLERVRQAVSRSWLQATGLHFTGFGSCSTGGGVIRIHVVGSSPCGATSCSDVGFNAANPTNVYLVVPASVGGAGGVGGSDGTIPLLRHPDITRELGRALGFNDERSRTDFVKSCQSGVSRLTGNTLDTLPDGNSITTWTSQLGTGGAGNLTTCTNNQQLSYWDRTGAQRAYGFPNYFADVNNDRRADLIAIRSDCITVLLSASNRFNLPPAPASACWTTGPWFGHKGTFFADVTGDGRADAVAIDNTRVLVRASTGTSFGPQRTWVSSGWYGEIETHVADVTGDGKADLIGIDAGGVFVRASTGSGFPSPTLSFGAPSAPEHGTFFADVAGNDGRADLVSVFQSGIVVRASTGTAFAPAATWLATSDVLGQRGTFFADVSGDGRADWIGVDSNRIRVRRADSASFGVIEDWRSSASSGERGTFFADTNADGRADVITVNEASNRVGHSTGAAFSSNLTYTSFGWYGTRLDGG